jgi:hypothetical protein
MPALSVGADVGCCSDLAKKLMPIRQTGAIATKAEPITRDGLLDQRCETSDSSGILLKD